MAFPRASDAELAARAELAALVAEDLRAVGFTVETGLYHRVGDERGVRVFWYSEEGPLVVYVTWYVHRALSDLATDDWRALVGEGVEPSFATATPPMHLEGVVTLAVREALARILRELGYQVADPEELLKKVYLEVSGRPAPAVWRRSYGGAVD